MEDKSASKWTSGEIESRSRWAFYKTMQKSMDQRRENESIKLIEGKANMEGEFNESESNFDTKRKVRKKEKKKEKSD